MLLQPNSNAQLLLEATHSRIVYKVAEEPQGESLTVERLHFRESLHSRASLESRWSERTKVNKKVEHSAIQNLSIKS